MSTSEALGGIPGVGAGPNAGAIPGAGSDSGAAPSAGFVPGSSAGLGAIPAGATPTAPAGLPDAGVLAQWANEFFSAIPGALPVRAPNAPAVPYAGNATGGAPVAPQLSEKDFRSAPQALAGAANKAPELGTQAPRGGFASPVSAPGSAFYFLEPGHDAYAAMPGLPATASYPSQVVPQFSEKDFRSAPQSLSGKAGQVSSAPDSPGASAPNGPAAPLPNGPAPSLPDSGLSFGFVPNLVAEHDSDPSVGVRLFDAASVKRDFPILSEVVNGRGLVWLDNAATTQKPQSVIDRISYFYEHENSNIHRGAHTLAARSTDAYEGAREKVRAFVNAPSVKNIVFARGATEAINLVAQSWGRRHLQRGDEIVITWLEHHSNIVPWQMLCSEKGARLRVAPIDSDGQVKLDEYEKLLGPRTRLVAFTQVSNALGTITPAAEMIAMAHRHGAKVLLDGAQAVSHMRVDVQSLDCDFYVFSGHKVFGPTGIGALYGKSDVLESMPPWQGGGNMIADVTFEKTVYHAPPMRFEAGTGNIADAVGLGAAIEYLERVGLESVNTYEHGLLEYGTEALKRVPGLRLIGTAREKAAVMSFVIEGIPFDAVGQALANEGIAVRAGHHCAQPAIRHFGLEGTVRPSLALYNTCDDIDALVDALQRLVSGRTVRRS